MPNTIEMIVTLKVPDATAITALQTLQRMGFSRIKGLKRAEYYKFQVENDLEKFKQQISKVDILVNANKHFYDFSVKDNNNIKILVKNTDDDGSGLLSTLKNRLGFKNIKKVEKGTLWSLDIDADNPAKIAESAAKDLLVNEHYQEYVIL